MVVASFNIRCFGRGGDYDGKTGVEHRLETLQDLFVTHLSNVDIIVLQEICNLEMLKEILPSGYSYISYPHEYPRHQFVVVVYKNRFSFEVSNAKNFSFDEILLNEKTSRPAICGRLVDSQNELKPIEIIGVHLKSGAYHSESRKDQWQKILDYVKLLDPQYPVIITGDFNTQGKVHTKKERNDIEWFDEMAAQIGIHRLENHKTTYKTQWESHMLDHIYFGGPIKPLNELKVVQIEDIFHGLVDRNAVAHYYEWISDHLPIIGEFQLGN